MALQVSTIFDAAWRHPLLVGSLLLLLTPSLFDLFLYFSPLLISTALFIVALISMGPRFEETREEGEKWAKGEQSVENNAVDPRYGPLSTPIDPPSSSSSFSIASIVNLLSPHDSEAWLAKIEELRARIFVWVDNMLKASTESSPASSASTSSGPSIESSIANVFCNNNNDLVNVPSISRQEQEEIVEDIPSVSENVPAAPPVVSPSPPEVVGVEQVVPSATSDIPEIPQPVWDIPSHKEDDDVNMPELEIVDAAALECNPSRDDDSIGIAKILDDIPLTSLESPASPADGDLIVKHILEPATVSPSKRVHFAKESSPNPLEFHSHLIKNMQAKIQELDVKRKNKYVEVLSRRSRKQSP